MSSDVLTASVPDLTTGVFTDTTPRSVAVSVRGLSKAYSIARTAEKHTTAGEALMHKLRNPFQKVERDTFWALNDVSFDIQKGDVVGIIGRNGAGKSTLLKILSRITEPTKGRIDLYGRVGSLLEVGTGFSAELTGRENIYLNGAILGMSRKEISRQFDAVVDFSGVEQFLDTPVKRYSSGMYVRLAFAVAAHLNPEILIVDEVLAVGDAEFQKKCIGKMQDVVNSGRTVLFVSHNMQSVNLLCSKGILLTGGEISYSGKIEGAVERYLSSFLVSSDSDSFPDRRPGSGEYRYTSVETKSEAFECGKEIGINFKIERMKNTFEKFALSAHIFDHQGTEVTHFDSNWLNYVVEGAITTDGSLKFSSPWLKPGTYRVDLVLYGNGIIDKFEDACRLNISPILPYPGSPTGELTSAVVLGDFQWTTSSDRLTADTNSL